MIDDYVLYKNLPELDLHENNRFEATMKVEEFINDNLILGKHLLRIIHGKGTYVLKNTIHEYLKKNKNVVAFRVDIFNDGVTIVEI